MPSVRAVLLGCVAALLLSGLTASCQAEPDAAESLIPLPAGKSEVTWEADPYYSDVGITFPLRDQAISTIRSNDELTILKSLIEGSFVPRFMLLEASVYPLPVLGTYLKSQQPDLFRPGHIGNYNFNWLESLTAGFQEPWAVSAFFGNIAKLVPPGEARKGDNIGYTGYLVSVGRQHIKNNQLIDDSWMEIEWKIKGKLHYEEEKLGWSFRLGGKYHAHPGISDVIYFSLFRSTLNLKFPWLSWLNNTTVNLKTHVSSEHFRLVRQEFIFGKKAPEKAWNKFVPAFETGLLWSSPDEYQGSLRDSTLNTLTLIFRPSIEF